MQRSARPNMQLTRQGIKLLDEDLSRLRAERPALAARIGAAREEAQDPVENLALRDALDALVQLDDRIAQREAVLAAAECVDEDTNTDGCVRVGTHVRVRDASGEMTDYILVSPPEANPRQGRLSVASPVGCALLGARTGESVTAETPGGLEQLTILAVS